MVSGRDSKVDKGERCDEKEIEEESSPSKPEEKQPTNGLEECVKKLQSALDMKETELSEARDAMLLARADLENFRKRALRERSDIRDNTISEVIENLLPVIDNFEIGLKAVDAASSGNVLSGFQMIYKQFQEFLSSYGVVEISAINEPFDMRYHDCVRKTESDDYENETVISVERKGYKRNDKLIRPAAVVVGCPQEKQEHTEE